MAEGSRRSQTSNPWSSLQQIHRNSHSIATSATQRFHDLQHYVVQGLTPLINSTSQRTTTAMTTSSNVSRSQQRSGWSQHGRDFDSSAQPTIHEPGSEHYVIEMDLNDGGTPSETVPGNNNDLGNDAFAIPQQQQLQQQTSNNNRAADSPSDVDSLRNSAEFQMFMTFVETYLPFVLILVMKLIFDHKLGILVIIGLFVTFYHSNSVVKREVAKQARRRFFSLLWVCLNLVMCIAIIYSVLAEDGLAFALVFVMPYSSPISLWDVLWVVSVTDFVIRMLTVLAKLCVLALPARLVPFHKKGTHYLFVERVSQLYRAVAPMQHWLYFFSEAYQGPGKVFGVVLAASYLIFKCKSILGRAKMWKTALFRVLHTKTYGETPSMSEIKQAGDSCPICQDDYKSPSMLQCKHIFCEDCVALWFDRERTCPICRAQIADDPSWRDGSTSLALQLF